jgi:glycosyltransferase involved in cell wall biosynthesis
VADTVLERTVPARLQSCTRILPNSTEKGICAALNRAVAAACHPWLIHLDCDDRISGDTLAVLLHYIGRHPGVRYISSRMLDIDADDRLLRVRMRGERPSELIDRGMAAGHLKAIRRDLFDAIGPYEAIYTGCQDYEFALRTSLVEPLLFIPEYLYAYRWHGQSQSVARAQRQVQTTRRIIDGYLLAARMLVTKRSPLPLRFHGPMASHWQACYSQPANEGRSIEVAIHRPPTELNQRLFAIHVGRYSADRLWHGMVAPSLTF